MNVPYNFEPNNRSMNGDEILQRCLQLDISAVELRSQPVEAFLGVPTAPLALRGGRRGAPPTPEQAAAQQAFTEQLSQWRVSAPMSKVADFRKTWEDAGVLIQIVKVDDIFTCIDDVLDYASISPRLSAAGRSPARCRSHKMKDPRRRAVRRQAR